MSITLAQIEADFENAVTATENFVIGVVGKIKAGVPVAESYLQSAAQWLYENGPGLIEDAADGLTVLSAAGLTHGIPQAASVVSEAQSVMAAYQSNYNGGAITESQLVNTVAAVKAAVAAPQTATVAAATAPVPAPAAASPPAAAGTAAS